MSPIRSQRGFALVGVVMFILVLTILGLSLFSLTGYESQFMQHSLDRSAAFEAAQGGLDRACFALSWRGELADVKSDLPLDGVIYAVAKSGADTTGRIDFNDPTAPPIVVRVLAQVNGERRFLESTYSTAKTTSLYKQLMALSGVKPGPAGLTVLREDIGGAQAGPPDNEVAWKATRLFGNIVQNDNNNPDRVFPVNWNQPGDPVLAQPTVSVGNVPDPSIDPIFTQYWIGASSAGGGESYFFNAGVAPQKVRFFRSPWTSGNWSVDHSGEVNVDVRGVAVWLVDHGLRSERTVHVSGGDSSMLVIVARKQTTETEVPNHWQSQYPTAYEPAEISGVGIALFGGIDSSIPVILVSDGGVLIENRDFGRGVGNGDDKTATTASYLSVFARYAYVLGPDTDQHYEAAPPAVKLTLAHYDGGEGDALIDKLSALGYLPNTSGAPKGRLRFLAGTWREVTESNPY